MPENPYAKYAPSLPSPPKQIDPLAARADSRAARADSRAERSLTLQEEAAARAAREGTFTPAQKAVDGNFATEYVDWAVKGGRADSQKARRQLADALARLEKEKTVTGPLVGAIPDWASAWVNPQAVATREDVEEVVQRNLRMVLGAQYTEKEGERLIARAYNPRLQEEENARRVGRLLRQIEEAAEAKEDAARYYEKNGTLRGWQGSLPTLSDFEDINFNKDKPKTKPKTPSDIDALMKKYGGK